MSSIGSKLSAEDGKLRCKRKLVVIITGDPKYISDPEVTTMAEAFYTEIAALVTAKGFDVEFDHGKPYTHPDRLARVWIAHDRGYQKLRHMGPCTIVVPLETVSRYGNYANDDAMRRHPDHYTLSERDKLVLGALQCEV